ncbi:MAG: Hsp20/alpha crystallin family protein [Nitrosopumilus sp.]|uniref:Hsp20/alpha crystallin family protein n=1 Tax=Nitrosopumilus sp. TaxID=2024843 RepID=UPI00247EC925|nr:Hsp20/alpha crystallin family protein [Nitrosopumilus sp.]MCV0392702.1 Hsp20/alpha crystallin family protein [Nitrosopumilus sp.]
MAKKPANKPTSFPTLSNLSDFDRAIDNFKRDLEKSFWSFPRMDFSFPKMPEAGYDIIDEGKQFRMKMDVPGLKKNEINLNVTDNSIEVTGEHKEEEKKKNYLRKERHSMSYYQTIPLSEKVVPGKVKAKLTDGVLDITLPKIKPTLVPKKRSVKVQ